MYVGDSYYNNVGAYMSFAGDVDGDGLDDVLIGAPGWADGQYNKGKAYLVLGSSIENLSLGSINPIDQADYTFTGTVLGDRWGQSMAV